MHTDTGQRAAVDWGGRPDDDEPDYESDERGWPILHPSCSEENPQNRHACILGRHNGRHRDDTGTEWLDNGL
jgi:hypothetical protein